MARKLVKKKALVITERKGSPTHGGHGETAEAAGKTPEGRIRSLACRRGQARLRL